MRRTMFVVAVEEAPILQAAASLGVARTERRRNRQLVELLGVEDADAWMRDAEAATLAALERRGEATPAELAEDVPALQARVRVNIGKRYEGEIGLASRVLLLLAVEGRIVRAKPKGTWISSQYRWTPLERWLGEPLAELPVADAQAELVRRWLARFGPGDRGGPALVDGIDGARDPSGARASRGRRGRPRRPDRPAAAR